MSQDHLLKLARTVFIFKGLLWNGLSNDEKKSINYI